MRKPLMILNENSAGENDSHSHPRINCENLQQLSNLKREKRLTPCLELLEKYGLVGDTAIFILSQVSLTWLSFGSGESTKTEIQGGQR